MHLLCGRRIRTLAKVVHDSNDFVLRASCRMCDHCLLCFCTFARPGNAGLPLRLRGCMQKMSSSFFREVVCLRDAVISTKKRQYARPLQNIKLSKTGCPKTQTTTLRDQIHRTPFGQFPEPSQNKNSAVASARDFLKITSEVDLFSATSQK